MPNPDYRSLTYRGLLRKKQHTNDGPAFPFDLTRTTNIADIADIIENRFYDMWNPRFLHYNPDANRIYHSKWTGLSFAHEVEDTDNPFMICLLSLNVCDLVTQHVPNDFGVLLNLQ
ncbi:hypothetical protein [Scytonema sp. NUACC26]|uniref:hypothetical protein n=1 Tax=Scytonema sp. NUACC26 TaxID=3140176 RepID=UPI0038B28CC1